MIAYVGKLLPIYVTFWLVIISDVDVMLNIKPLMGFQHEIGVVESQCIHFIPKDANKQFTLQKAIRTLNANKKS